MSNLEFLIAILAYVFIFGAGSLLLAFFVCRDDILKDLDEAGGKK